MPGPHPGLGRLFRVMSSTEEVERDVRFITDDPAIMRNRRDMEQLSRPKLDHPSIGEGSGRCTGEYKPDVLDATSLLPKGWTDVLGPLPAWLVCGPADRHTTEVDELELAQDHLPDLIRSFEALQHHVNIGCTQKSLAVELW